MIRVILGIVLALGTVVGAYADTSTYYWQGKGQWNDAQLQAAAQVCDQRYGVVENGAVTSANYKRCMLRQGWEYGGTAREKTYTDPNTGMSCRSIGGGSICEPPQGTVKYTNKHGLSCTRTGAMSVCTNL